MIIFLPFPPCEHPSNPGTQVYKHYSSHPQERIGELQLIPHYFSTYHIIKIKVDMVSFSKLLECANFLDIVLFADRDRNWTMDIAIKSRQFWRRWVKRETIDGRVRDRLSSKNTESMSATIDPSGEKIKGTW